MSYGDEWNNERGGNLKLELMEMYWNRMELF